MRHSSYLEVNLGLMAQNFENIQKLAPKAEILPMVKADGYGNGLVPIANFLTQEFGVKKLGCASLGEAMSLIESSRSFTAEILVFSDTELLNETAREVYLSYNVSPVLHQISDLDVVLKTPGFEKIPLIIKLNTGMNRLGISLDELAPYVKLLKERGIEHLMTHFARASQLLKAEDKTHRQYDEFRKTHQFLIDNGVEVRTTSVSNSGAIEQKFGVCETYVRPGLMLYGPASLTSPYLWRGHQVSRFVTKVLSSFKVNKGTPVGYGVNVADRDAFIVIIPLGYADGMISIGTGTLISINGRIGKIFGRINMDMSYIIFDIEAALDIKNEDVVEIWSHDNRIIADLATQNKTLPYQLMCGISSRIPRIYKVK